MLFHMRIIEVNNNEFDKPGTSIVKKPTVSSAHEFHCRALSCGIKPKTIEPLRSMKKESIAHNCVNHKRDHLNDVTHIYFFFIVKYCRVICTSLLSILAQ